MTTPEEDFNQEVWYVLGKIQKEKLATIRGKSVEYGFPVRQVIGVGVVSQERQKKILSKLQEWGALKIRENPWEPLESTPNLYYLDLIEPRYEETYKKYQKACDINSYLNDFQQKSLNNEKVPEFSQVEQDETKIDKWLESKDDWTLQKIWQVVSALNSAWQLEDEDTFEIPQDKFERAKITNPKDLEAVLKNLHKQGIVEILRKVAEASPSNDPNTPRMSAWITIIEQPEIAHKPDTQVKIIPQKFTYLRDSLKRKVTKQEVVKEVQTTEKFSKIPEWPDDFEWKDDVFVFGKYGTISFTSQDRKFILEKLTVKKGDWATINELKGNKDAGYVRSTIKQIEDRLSKDAKKYIVIVSTQDDNFGNKPSEGAYRIKLLG